MRAIALGQQIYYKWAEDEENIRPPLVASERALIQVWQYIREAGHINNAQTIKAYAVVLTNYLDAASAYASKLDPFYMTENAFCELFDENVFVTELVFEELGRLGLNGSILFYLSSVEDDSAARAYALQECSTYAIRLKTLLRSHTIVHGPCYDGHAIDIALAAHFLLQMGETEAATLWIAQMVKRIKVGRKLKYHFPIDSDSIDDVLAMRISRELEPEKLATMSTLLPLLAQLSVALGSREIYADLVENLLPLFGETTLQTWYPDRDYENQMTNGMSHRVGGVVDAPQEFHADFDAYAATAWNLPPGAAVEADFDFGTTGAAWIPLIFARHYRSPVPLWYFSEREASNPRRVTKPA